MDAESSHMEDCPFDKIYPSELNRDDAYYMALAYNLAVDAWRCDEVPIGAVIVHEGRIIGAAHNSVEQTGDPTAHAEVLAITQASRGLGDWRLNGATLYVTKEPCPMCSGASIMARLSRVVYGVADGKMGCLGGATALHSLPGLNHRVEVVSGVMEQECVAILRAFFAKKRQSDVAVLDAAPDLDINGTSHPQSGA